MMNSNQNLMVKESLTGPPLPNTSPQDFKSQLTKISNGLFSFPLILKDNSIINVPIRQDGFLNATQMCKDSGTGKLFADWYKLKQTKDLLQALKSDMNILITELIEVKRGGTNQGSWIHPDLGVPFAQWLSAPFAIRVSRAIRTLFMFGKVEL
jgi:hypothetical protein